MNSKDYERHLLAKEAERERELLHQQEVEKRMRLELSYIELIDGKELLKDIEEAILDFIREERTSGVMDMIEEGLFTAIEILREAIQGQLDSIDY